MSTCEKPENAASWQTFLPFVFFKNQEETFQRIRNSGKSSVDTFSIQFFYLSSCVDWEKRNNLWESKLKLSLLPSQIKTESIISSHELLGPGPLIPLGPSTTSKHLTHLHPFAKTSTNNRTLSRLEVVTWSGGVGHRDMQMWDFLLWTAQGDVPETSHVPGKWLERHQFRTELLLIFS